MERRIGPELLGIMSPRSRTAMQKSWEEQVKFKFGTPAQNRNTDFEVVVPGIADDETLDIHEAFHLMARFVLRRPELNLCTKARGRLQSRFIFAGSKI